MCQIDGGLDQQAVARGPVEAFNGTEGVNRIVDRALALSLVDPRIAEVFVATDMVRLRRTIKKQFCHLLNGGCAYTGGSMKDAHADIDLQPADMGALVEHLQTAMSEEGVPFHTQNRFLARLAPMHRDVVTRGSVRRRPGVARSASLA